MGPTPKEYGCTPTEFCENQSSTPNEFLNFYLTPKEILNFYNLPLKPWFLNRWVRGEYRYEMQ